MEKVKDDGESGEEAQELSPFEDEKRDRLPALVSFALPVELPISNLKSLVPCPGSRSSLREWTYSKICMLLERIHCQLRNVCHMRDKLPHPITAVAKTAPTDTSRMKYHSIFQVSLPKHRICCGAEAEYRRALLLFFSSYSFLSLPFEM